MKYRRLGRSNLQVSELCLGTMMFGDQTDANGAARIVDRARERGVNFIDTADVYTQGASERVLAALISKGRDDWIVASKIGNTMSERPNEGRYSRKWMMRELDASLARLGTDYVDLYYLHRDFEDESLEEAVRSLQDMTRAGKIRYFGLSNFRGWRIAEVVRVCDALGAARPVICQPYYNLLNRMPEVEILPACASYGIGVVPYSPIARGVLSGKYLPGQAPEPGSRAARNDKRIMQTEWRPESLEIAQTLAAHATRRGVTLAQFAVAWLLANRVLSSVIAGPRTLDQWDGYFGALDFEWQAEDEALVDSLVAPGHPSTPGYTDPAYPLSGRKLR
ncbi:MAG: aldo/keto reductase [Burkholderiaceae bacterium]|nr:aldo/keto reductase [Burkholderiaceae bacterium]